MFPFRTVGLLPAARSFQGFHRLHDNLLSLSVSFFQSDFDFQTAIIRQSACLRPDLALRFVKLAGGSIFRIWFQHH